MLEPRGGRKRGIALHIIKLRPASHGNPQTSDKHVKRPRRGGVACKSRLEEVQGQRTEDPPTRPSAANSTKSVEGGRSAGAPCSAQGVTTPGAGLPPAPPWPFPGGPLPHVRASWPLAAQLCSILSPSPAGAPTQRAWGHAETRGGWGDRRPGKAAGRRRRGGGRRRGRGARLPQRGPRRGKAGGAARGRPARHAAVSYRRVRSSEPGSEPEAAAGGPPF